MSNKGQPPVKLALFLHCRKCVTQRLRPVIEVGVTADGSVVVWCKNHDEKVWMSAPGVGPMGGCQLCQEGKTHAH